MVQFDYYLRSASHGAEDQRLVGHDSRGLGAVSAHVRTRVRLTLDVEVRIVASRPKIMRQRLPTQLLPDRVHHQSCPLHPADLRLPRCRLLPRRIRGCSDLPPAIDLRQAPSWLSYR